MEEQERQEFDLDDILREFSDHPQQAQPEQETVETLPEQMVSGDTIRMDALSGDTIRMDAVSADAGNTDAVPDDTIRMDAVRLPKGKVRIAEPLEEEQNTPEEEEAFPENWEPEYEQPIGEYVPPQPIVFQPRSRLRELKRKLVAGPEKRYYELAEKGLGKLQAAIFISLLVVLVSAGATAMYALGLVQENRLRLMIFGQLFAVLVSALLGSFQLIEGATDLLKGKFSLNTLLLFTFLFCCMDAVLCLKQLRVPCCAALSLEMTMSLWSTYQRRSTEIGQVDTMRKANHLDGLCAVSNYYAGRTGFVRREGQVEDYTDSCREQSAPEKVLSVYALVALLVSVGIGITAAALHGIYAGIQVTAAALLAALPATAFITLSRPMGLLERRLHSLGTVLCGWKGVAGLCGKAVFPVTHEDLFPAGAVRMNGVKFYGSRNPDEVVAYGTAVITADGGGLAPLFSQVLESRNGIHYDVQELRTYESGGVGAVVDGEAVLVGSLSFLKEMGVEVPGGIRVKHAVCVAIDGELCGLFAITYEKVKSSVAGLGTLCAYRGLNPVLVAGDFALTHSFMRSRFGVNPKRILYPNREQRLAMLEAEPEEEARTLLLVTSRGLAPFAYGVTGARALRTASILGTAVHMTGGILGLAVMLIMTVLGSLELLTPANMLLYQLAWMIPGLLITEWTRAI